MAARRTPADGHGPAHRLFAIGGNFLPRRLITLFGCRNTALCIPYSDIHSGRFLLFLSLPRRPTFTTNPMLRCGRADAAVRDRLRKCGEMCAGVVLSDDGPNVADIATGRVLFV